MLNLVLALSSGAIGSLILAFLPRLSDRLRKYIVILSCTSGIIFSWIVAQTVFSGAGVQMTGGFGGFIFKIAPDELGVVFSLIVSTLWLFAGVYSFGYMADKGNLRTYYSFFLLSLSVSMGVAYSGNLIALYLFYELLTFVTYPLVIHDRSPKAMKAGAQYILYNLLGAGFILIAIIATYARAGTGDFTATAILTGQTGTGLNLLLFVFLIGFGVKAALFPLHKWLPEAMAAPTPVSALLHAVAVVYAGVYGLLRVTYSVFGFETIKNLNFAYALKWIAAFTILAGILVAARQDVLKRRLAYQTISHLSYILLGAFIFHPWGLAGAILQMIGYSVLKMVLFFCAGIIAERTGQTEISKFGGIGYSLPWTMVAFSVASLGMIGMMPLSTFWSKYYLMKGSVQVGVWPLAALLVVSGIINAICFIPIIIKAFQGEKRELMPIPRKNHVLMLAPVLLLTAVALVIGLWPGLVWPGVERVAQLFFKEGGVALCCLNPFF